ncbi:hypothetical protein DGMP_21600 [Desulfomarina profundi]|uniref:Uncharacterized protein n=1 Tax=Desulfomarina profundi TaxID=2772557 RepID=A0A8D5FH10_9BACT|nr:DUF2142 domain-containing protein [Desulfomarina profundi]BCL61467.1 hypothetical protein DGMP_21600 [Desulfomarina profundi]
MNRRMQYVNILILCLLAMGLYYLFFIKTAHVVVDLVVTEKTDFKIYWARAGQPYSEEHMSMVIARPGRNHYSFFLTDIGKLARLRIDTHRYKGEATLRRLKIEQEGYASYVFAAPRDFRQLVPLAQIEEFTIDRNGIRVVSTGEDPNFELRIQPEYRGISYFSVAVRFLVISFFVFLVYRGGTHLSRNFLFVPLFLFGAWILIITMAGISERNVHPDEYVHLYATQYYDDHWLPPHLEDESVRQTYSVYGVSRLNNGEVYYFFSGKFHKLLEGFKIPEYFSLRLFNVLLFGLILLYTVGSRCARLVAIPLLLSPQIWYVFSYCDSDAFALFVTFLVGCELVSPSSFMRRFLEKRRCPYLCGLVLLGSLLGCLFLLKKNYYPFVAFFYLCLGAQLFFTLSAETRKRAMKRLLAISVVGLILFGMRVGADYVVNGLDRNEKIRVLQEERAHPWYKPSTELHNKHVSLYRKARGTTLKEMVTVERWFERSFQSAFGVFGYFTISAPLPYYDLVRWTGAALLVFVFGSIFLRGGVVESGLALSVLCLSSALIAVSLYHSWTVDFQAQGRYLFPIIPMLGILYARTYRVIYQPVLLLGVTCMYMLGVYAFIFEALLRIPKVVFH